MKRLLVLSLITLFIIPISILKAGDDVESYLAQIGNLYGEEYIKGYIQPLSTSLGTALGGSLYHRGYTKGFPRFDVGISMVYVPIPDEAKAFESPVSTIQGDVPTVFGDATPQVGAISGADQSFFLLPMLHANVGLFANMEATARFMTADIDYLGKLTVYGGGLKYGLSELLPIGLLPLDFSVQAAYHKFTLGEFLDAGTFSMNFQASVSIPVLPVDFYGGVGFDNSSMTIETDKLEFEGSTVGLGNITVDGENQFRANVGVSLTFLIVNFHVDYTLGKYNSIGAGLMVVL